jgi:putative ATP-binding cassette transporter
VDFVQFLRKETAKPLYKIPIMAAMAGIANAVLIGIINNAAQQASYDNLNFRNLLLFSITIILFILAQKYVLHESRGLVESILARLRVRMADKIQRANLLQLENIGETEIYNRLTQETQVISNGSAILIVAIQSVVMLGFLALYIAFLSRMAFLLIVVILVMGVFIYLNNHKTVQAMLLETNESEMVFFDSLRDCLDGLKENKLNRRRREGLYSHVKSINESLENQKIATGIRYDNNFIFTQVFYNVLIGIILFLLPRFSPTYTGVLTQLTAAILFMVGPVGLLVGAMQTYDQVNFSVSNIYRLEDELEKIIEIDREHPQYNKRLSKVRRFDKIRLKNLEFSYKDNSGNKSFSIGPFNLDIQSGETLFIVGGNGSGKTTLLRVLCMLYYPDSGYIALDNIKIQPANVADFRELFSAVFSDFHLFSRLFGMEDLTRQRVEKLLKAMELEEKTQFSGDRFSTLELSTGQRKRLALLISLLEDKSIYIFDEWAADQDPEFRQYFYKVILKELKKRGKTIIAASHDDRFFHHADRVIKLDFGKIANNSGDPLKEGRK